MKKIIIYKEPHRHCCVGDVVFLGTNLTEKAELIAIHESYYFDVYVFKPLANNSIFTKAENGNIPFYEIPYIYAKEVEVKED